MKFSKNITYKRVTSSDHNVVAIIIIVKISNCLLIENDMNNYQAIPILASLLNGIIVKRFHMHHILRSQCEIRPMPDSIDRFSNLQVMIILLF